MILCACLGVSSKHLGALGALINKLVDHAISIVGVENPRVITIPDASLCHVHVATNHVPHPSKARQENPLRPSRSPYLQMLQACSGSGIALLSSCAKTIHSIAVVVVKTANAELEEKQRSLEAPEKATRKASGRAKSTLALRDCLPDCHC